MAHTHSVYDDDLLFSVDPISRTITYSGEGPLILCRGDHNSERYTFEVPRYVEGHDMYTCDIVQIHFINIGSGGSGGRSSGVYKVTDMELDLEVYDNGDEFVNFSWLISQEATERIGSLNFVIRMACSSGSKIEYSWNTTVFNGVSVVDSINNTDIVVEQYNDVLEQWYWELIMASDSGINGVLAAKTEAMAEIAEAKAEVVNDIKSQVIDASSQEIVAGVTGQAIADKISEVLPLAKGDQSNSIIVVNSANAASGAGSFAHGQGTTSTGNNSHTEGYSTLAEGNNSHAEGRLAKARGENSHAEGYDTLATGINSHTEGINTKAEGEASHAEGKETTAKSQYSHAEGYKTTAEGFASHAEGTQTVAKASYSHAEGFDGDAEGEYSHAEGTGTIATGKYSHAEGSMSQAIGESSHAEGSSAKAYGDDSHAEGYMSQAHGVSSHAEGGTSKAIGNFSHAEGSGAVANGDSSHAEGQHTTTAREAYYSHVEGYKTATGAKWSHAEGKSARAMGEASHAEGEITLAEGVGSHAEGYDTSAKGAYSHAEGNETLAEGAYSHAEGRITASSGDYSHSEGYDTTASGLYSHAEGESTKANGQGAHAEGCYTEAKKNYSHAEGIGTIADGEGQTVVGRYNQTTDDALFIVGDGEDANNRSNAFWIDRSGKIRRHNGILKANYVDGLEHSDTESLPSAYDLRINLTDVYEPRMYIAYLHERSADGTTMVYRGETGYITFFWPGYEVYQMLSSNIVGNDEACGSYFMIEKTTSSQDPVLKICPVGAGAYTTLVMYTWY